jgi:hypothetical protein
MSEAYSTKAAILTAQIAAAIASIISVYPSAMR